MVTLPKLANREHATGQSAAITWRTNPQLRTDRHVATICSSTWHRARHPHRRKGVEKTITRSLKDHRIRSPSMAATVLQTLRKTTAVVARGHTESACAHIRTIAARLRLVISRSGAAPALDGPARNSKHGRARRGRTVDTYVTILRSCQEIGRIVLATLPPMRIASAGTKLPRPAGPWQARPVPSAVGGGGGWAATCFVIAPPCL